jgi:hypothetical protein
LEKLEAWLEAPGAAPDSPKAASKIGRGISPAAPVSAKNGFLTEFQHAQQNLAIHGGNKMTLPDSFLILGEQQNRKQEQPT